MKTIDANTLSQKGIIGEIALFGGNVLIFAFAEKTSRSEIIRSAIVRCLAVKRFQQLRKKVLPFAEA